MSAEFPLPLWLFLDYDGTLAGFAPNPDVVLPDPELIELLRRLARYPDLLRVSILSGRRLAHIRQLVPVHGVLLAGTYGLEIQTWDGGQIVVANSEDERPLLERPLLEALKTSWANLIAPHSGFYLEDKGFAIALHGRDAAAIDADRVFTAAQGFAELAAKSGHFRVQSGQRFLEVAPLSARKGDAVRRLLERFPWPGAHLVYIGDDDKDEEAFEVIRQRGGRAILVAESPRPTAAQERLPNPLAVRAWLEGLLEKVAREAQAASDTAVAKNTGRKKSSSTLPGQRRH